ncbi:zeta toxin family protein [Streptomyces sp. NPDC059459]|uniref:zeta toxin family protein n=1 Tax=Streptomyces sp. NPDC059459 TaxID=3346839 RepID=UPI00369136E6
MVVLGGPQGSRKTTLRPVVAEQLGLGDDVVYFDGDDHNDFHPYYDRLARQHGAPEAARLIREDNEIIRGAILSEVRTRRLSIMFVGPYTHPEYTLGRLAEFRGDGYRTEVAYTASCAAATPANRWTASWRTWSRPVPGEEPNRA